MFVAPGSTPFGYRLTRGAAQQVARNWWVLLLNGVLLDESRNALGRQRIAHLRDELRAYDRQHEVAPITRSPRW